ncbi:ribosomal silencing factor during starvation domain-containing protein [Ditylenchus destructor]|nr:ribosomal silencing factor during starvation domain-containing protein [Ditylenchus destructor]
MKLEPNDGPFPYVILGTPYNHKHEDVIGRLPSMNPELSDWYTFELRNVMVHMMSEENRQKYDFESLFAIGQNK